MTRTVFGRDSNRIVTSPFTHCERYRWLFSGPTRRVVDIAVTSSRLLRLIGSSVSEVTISTANFVSGANVTSLVFSIVPPKNPCAIWLPGVSIS